MDSDCCSRKWNIMNHHSSPKSATTLTVLFTLVVTTLIVATTLFITSKLYQQANYLDNRWTDYRTNIVKKQQLTRELKLAFTEQGLLGQIRRYALSPNKVTENHIKNELVRYKNIIDQYRHLTALSTTETRLLITINREIDKLKNSFYLITNFASKNQVDKYTEMGDSLYAPEGQEAVDKILASNTAEYNDETKHINDVVKELLLLILSSLIIMPVVAFFAVNYWLTRHKVSKDLLHRHNRPELDKVFRHSAIPTMIVNRSGDIVNANAAITELTGYSMNYLLSKHLEQIIVKAPVGFLKQIMTLGDIHTKGNSVSQLQTSKGDITRVEIDITQMMDNENLLSIISFRDVEQAQQALDMQQSVMRMHDFSQSTSGVGSWYWDFSSNQLLWSSKTYELYGYDNQDIELSQEIILAAIPSDEREGVSNAINEAVIFGNELNLSHHIKRQNGELIFVYQKGHVVSGDNDKALYMLGTIEVADKNDDKTFMRDVSDRVFNSSLDAMAVTNQRNVILKVNNAFIDTTGFSEEEAVGQQLSSINRATFFDQCIYNRINEQVQQSKSWVGELWNVRKDGEVYPTTQHICALAHEEDHVSRYLCTFRDISEQKALEERIINSRAIDRITMLPSRSVLQDRLNQSIKRHERDGNHSAVLVISIKPFSQELDESSHTLAIKTLAQRLLQITRDHDTIARFGHYEFSVLLEGLALGEDAYIVADKIQMKLNENLVIAGEKITPVSAIGISLHPLHATSDETLIQYADAAMQQAKLEQNGTIQTFNQHILGIYNSEQHLNAQLQRAIDLKELAVNYQPVISFDSQQIVRCIAHVRWHHRAYNTQDTEKFIASAKNGSLSKPLHDWLLENAVKYATQWSNSGLTQLQLQIKIVSDQLKEPGLAQKIKNILNTYQFAAEQLVVEITHDTLQLNEQVTAELDALTAVGIKLLVVNLPDEPQTFNDLKTLNITEAHTKRIGIGDSQITNDTAQHCERVITQIKHADIYPSNFDWKQQAFVSMFKDVKSRKQQQLFVCGSVDSQSLIVLGNKLLNTTT